MKPAQEAQVPVTGTAEYVLRNKTRTNEDGATHRILCVRHLRCAQTNQHRTPRPCLEHIQSSFKRSSTVRHPRHVYTNQLSRAHNTGDQRRSRFSHFGALQSLILFDFCVLPRPRTFILSQGGLFRAIRNSRQRSSEASGACKPSRGHMAWSNLFVTAVASVTIILRHVGRRLVGKCYGRQPSLAARLSNMSSCGRCLFWGSWNDIVLGYSSTLRESPGFRHVRRWVGVLHGSRVRQLPYFLLAGRISPRPPAFLRLSGRQDCCICHLFETRFASSMCFVLLCRFTCYTNLMETVWWVSEASVEEIPVSVLMPGRRAKGAAGGGGVASQLSGALPVTTRTFDDHPQAKRDEYFVNGQPFLQS